MSHSPLNPGLWPIVMRAETAAAYLDEVSVEAFMRRVGSVYSRPALFPGRRKVWRRIDLDSDIKKLSTEAVDVEDAAQLL